MADIYVSGSVVGDTETRDYQFRIVQGGRHIELPQSDIDALGLKPSLFARTTGRTERTTGKGVYAAGAYFAEGYIELDVLPAEIPAVGVAVLRDLGFSVDLDKATYANPTTPLIIHRGLSPWVSQVADDRVYLAADDGQVYGLDARNPEPLYKSSLPEGTRITHLTVAGDLVYVVSDAGFVYALGARNLDEIWRSRLLAGRPITHLAVADRRVYLALADGWIYALHGGNLEMEWRNNLLEGKTITHLAVADHRIYLALTDGRVHALDARNLEWLWSTPLPEGKKIARLAVTGDWA